MDHQLVSHGPYRYVRHPVYTALFAIAVGHHSRLPELSAAGCALMSIVAHLWWAAAEETLLSSPGSLGGDYRIYASRTGRFLPRAGRTGRRNGSL
ncbi:MAG TPA: isoprenylcysteine carboxylmethyltransferase family protein [Acidimicrobiia bacterium]|nr:isoprenylcysteine carboxylmethyltransferase family protein [Acidimicrobiia bacterium]